LERINKEHLKGLDAIELSRYVGFADINIGELAKIYLEEVSTTKELKSKIDLIFANKQIPKELEEEAETIKEVIKSAPYFEEYDDFKNYVIEQSNLKSKNISKLIRLLLTNVESGPDIALIYKYLKNYMGKVIK
jgi:glutamyl-tRNA synthetase